MKISVIICSYNPKDEILIQCLDHISGAISADVDAEVIIVDNNSRPALIERETLRRFLGGPFRFVVEQEQGLTPARLRGIREAKSDLLVFVDDDNFVDEEFLREGLRIASENQFIGAYSGQVELVFESEAPAWTKRYWGLLVYRQFEASVWSNLPLLDQTMPCGAGLFVRKEVASEYLRLHEEGKRNIKLDRTGSSLFSGGDNDLAACACDIGLGVGLFCELTLKHYIPKQRLEKKYLLALTRGIATSSVVLHSFRGAQYKPRSFKARMLDLARMLLMTPTERAFHRATIRGQQDGFSLLHK
jgi:glycosyltransferase involved in cell wall biosynthesis